MSRHRLRPIPTLQFTPPQNLRELLDFVDLRELFTAVLVVSAVLIGSRAAPGLFAQAKDIVVTQAFFEFPMALLAVAAGYAEGRSSRGARAVILLIAAAWVVAAGSQELLKGDAPLSVIVPGLWVVYARLAPPSGVAWFSVLHCKVAGMCAFVAWVTLVVALALLMLLSSAAPANDGSGEAREWVYAFGWGVYYLALAFVLPAVRRRYLPRPKATSAAGASGVSRLSRHKTGKSSAARAR